MNSTEPTLAALSSPTLRYFLATRPAFLGVTLFACAIGLATAYYDDGGVSAATAAVTVIFALLAHAGVNVLNDYYDALNGTDAMNTDRIFPYTGGSRFIQNGVLTPRETAVFGATLFGVVMAAGIWLAWISGAGLLAIGAAGLLIGWAYSAPPLRLNSRGAGELCVAVGFGLIAVGADYVQRRGFAALPVVAVASYALLVTNILYINQFPDRAADQAAGKHHWVVRLGAKHARWGYIALICLAYGWLVAMVITERLPALTLIALTSVPISRKAAAELLRHASHPQRLAPAIQTTIVAASAHGLLVSLALALTKAFA
ncbi:MAG: prenyltransferase [Betaproteobacteria bacterium RIFCSPLOWO2_12_FULL_62_58]|nr:MAG: prenyltransferase [Betaproteobacteria bacterium RIFCSPLOWO2_12_FULL_62_58]